MVNIEFIDKSYMLPVAVYLNKCLLEGTCKEYDVMGRVHLNRCDGLVHIRISEVLQVITPTTRFKLCVLSFRIMRKK